MALLTKNKIALFQKKLKAASLVETLVATVIIVLMFSVASLTLNNVFKNFIINNTDVIENELTHLMYQYKNQQIKAPYFDEFKDWEVTIQKLNNKDIEFVVFEATHKKHRKVVRKKIIDVTK